MAKINGVNKSGLEVGTIVPLGHSSVNSNFFLPCDGTTRSRTEYANLFAAIGTAWGEGDGSTTFNLPDMRGRVPRGRDNGAGRDPDAGSRTAAATGGATGDNVGSVQGQATRKNGLTIASSGAHGHTSTNTTGSHDHAVGAGNNYQVSTDAYDNLTGTGREVLDVTNSIGDNYDTRAGNHSHSVNSGGSAHVHTINNGDNETRMKNAYVEYAIAYV